MRFRRVIRSPDRSPANVAASFPAATEKVNELPVTRPSLIPRGIDCTPRIRMKLPDERFVEEVLVSAARDRGMYLAGSGRGIPDHDGTPAAR